MPTPMGAVVVLGSTNTDLVLRTSQLPSPGQTVLGDDLQEFGGGKGANQAVAARRAGARVSFVAAMGDDYYGLSRRAELENERIDLTYLKVVHSIPSGVALILVNHAGENIIGVASGANRYLLPDDIARVTSPPLGPGSIFVAPWETPTDTIRAGLKHARATGATTLFNPAPVAVIDPADDWLSLVDFLVLNEHELAQIHGQPSLSATDALPMVQRLHNRGVGSVIVTLGGEGYLSSHAGEIEMQPAFSVEAVDTVGAGDTFVGALACRLAERNPLPAAARWAAAAAALSVTKHGAQASIPHRHEVDAFLARVDATRQP